MPTGNLPSEGKKLFEEVYQKALKGSCKGDKGCAAGSAWKAVHNAGWKKDAQGKWHKSEVFTEFSMRIDRASYDKASGERRVRIVASDTDEDNRGDSMSLELFNDFIDRIKKNEPVPEEFQSEFWKSGEPYISVSHYPDSNGKTVPGTIDATYVDGSYLKSKGKFSDTPLGRKCFEAVCSDLYGDTKDREDKIRISIAFLDYVHQHKSNGFIFDRKKAEIPYCPECIKEMLEGKSEGKIFLRGQLIHEALTRVPVNTRTSMEVDKSMADKILTRKDDAKSIVGDELADELEEQAELIGKSDALVIRSEEEEKVEKAMQEAPGDVEEDCIDKVTGEVDPDCTAKKVGEIDNSEVEDTPILDEVGEDIDELDRLMEEEVDVVEEAASEKGRPASDYLVVDKDGKKHLPVKVNGKPNHRLMAAARAALQSNFRGHSYGGPSKSAALAKLKRLYASEKMKWESEIVESEPDDAHKELKDWVIATLKSYIEVKEKTMPTETPAPAHPLDTYFSEFKQKFDEIVNSDASAEEKLQQTQEPFNSLGTNIVSIIKSSVKAKEVAPETKAQMDIVAALSQVMNPIAQKLDLVLTQLATPTAEKPIMAVPQRRSIPPSVVQQLPQQPVTKSETPHLRAIIEKTT